MGGHPSVNFVAMYSLDGQGKDRNVFSNTWTHYVAKPRSAPLKVVGAAFHLSLPLISGQPAGRCALDCVHAPRLPAAWSASASASPALARTPLCASTQVPLAVSCIRRNKACAGRGYCMQLY